jgi:hypothetical protein
MYFFARKLNGVHAGLVTAVVYQLIPYHILDLFERGVLPELFAFIWFPLILLFIREIFIKKSFSSMIYMSLAYAGLIITHLVSSFMFTFVMIGYGLYIFFIEKKKGMIRMFYAMALGLGLASVYLIPVVFERKFIHIEFINIFDYKDCFLFLYKNLIHGTFHTILHGIVIGEATFLIISFLLIRKKCIEAKNVFFVLLLSISLFLTIPLSSCVWRYMPGFSNLQFPWRWLLFSGLSISVIAGNLLTNSKKEVQKAAGIVLLPFIIISLFTLFKPSAPIDINFWREHPSVFSPPEYRPVWVKDPKKKLPAVDKVQVINGNGTIDIIDWKSNKRILSVNGETKLRLRFSTFYYPGWEGKIDDRQCDIMIDKDSGSMVIEVPKGRHNIELTFTDTSVRYYGKVISVISFVMIPFIYLFEIRRLNKNKSWGAG